MTIFGTVTKVETKEIKEKVVQEVKISDEETIEVVRIKDPSMMGVVEKGEAVYMTVEPTVYNGRLYLTCTNINK